MYWPAGLLEFSCSSWYALADHFPSNWSLSVSEKKKIDFYYTYMFILIENIWINNKFYTSESKCMLTNRDYTNTLGIK